MGRSSKYPRELRERAVRMVAEVRPDYPSEYQAMTAVTQVELVCAALGGPLPEGS